ncbi:glycosyltransferase involved in cell wall biosynthesis [Luteibacter rhizovicinus]|uniref:Glycosyltransferase involved in cell wall biosynthesis n=1 Tax=Luteibacter rhizovicinus TaxID=242606 RepID=A0A4R3YTB5_9GAMM|nr:glycosyltransferase [Luteibacter rhizovicinus]TCV95740.1 glycosyltransferase involved in cell wall biosynthesis [Luteibacter rhizovicinus]
MDIGWKLRRLGHLVRRLKGSIAIRGWHGTLRRAMRDRGVDDSDVNADVALRAPAEGKRHRRILVVETMTPDPTRDSGSMRLCHIFELLNADGWYIDFIADDDDAMPRDIARLAALGVEVHRGNPAPWMREHGMALDAVMLCRLPVADQYVALTRRLAPKARIIFDTVDLHYVREDRAAALTSNAALARQAIRSRKRELDMVARADVTLVVSGKEREILAREAPQSRVELVSNIHRVAGRSQPFASRSGLLFVGGFGHPPNEDAVRWFAAEVLPLVRERDTSIVFHVVGDIDESTRHAIAQPGMIVHGRVNDLAPVLAQTRVSVAPLRFGAGVKGKVNQAMSHGLPVVLTTLAAEGMYLQDDIDALIADQAGAMADAIDRVYHDEALWMRLSDGGLENVRSHFSTERARETLRRALNEPSA